MFKLDPIQEEAIQKICEWYTYMQKPYFVLAGRAGTGKSSIVKMAVEQLAISSSEMAFIAPTGKASMVMRKKGITDAITMHKLIYIPMEEREAMMRELKAKQKFSIFNKKTHSLDEIANKIGNGETVEDIFMDTSAHAQNNSRTNIPKEDVYFIKKDKAELAGYKLIVCDEASLINDEQITDLESFGIPVLYIGDHHQLPPVKGSNSRITNPDFTLEHIHRQDGNSDIITLASDIIDDPNRRIKLDSIVSRYIGSKEICQITADTLIKDFPKYNLNTDQILCSTNRLKDILNQACRVIRGYKDPIPMLGDKLMCIRNNYQHKLVNGLQGYVDKIKGVEKYKGIMTIDFRTEADYTVNDVDVSLIPFFPPGTFSEATEKYHQKAKSTIDLFDFGYACTVHKSQGSEWDNILYVQCYSHPNEMRQMHYTAITRAAKKIVITECMTNDDINYLDEVVMNSR